MGAWAQISLQLPLWLLLQLLRTMLLLQLKVLKWHLGCWQSLTAALHGLSQEEKVAVVSQQVDLASMSVEDSYTGPRMEGG